MFFESFFPIRNLPGAFLPVLAAVLVAAFCPGTAHASNLLVDGTFEAAGGGNTYYAGQSIDGGSWDVTAGAIYIDSQDPWVYDGNNSVNLTYASLYAPNSLSQTVATTVGQQYTLSFFGNADTPNSFSVTENGTSIAGLPSSIAENGFPSADSNGNSSLFVDYTANFVATSASTDLTFTSTGDPALFSPDGSVMIDDVNLEATPEPASAIMTLTGILGLGFIALRKRFRASASTLEEIALG